ncbi:MAG: hypothetical protein JNM76_17010 [Betaproteobacteria bacterium]|nr:hypothetical protein [Betaproteobacteria bacterium]
MTIKPNEILAESDPPTVAMHDGILVIDYGHVLIWTVDMSWRSFAMAAPYFNPAARFRVLILLRSEVLLSGSFDQFLNDPKVQDATAATAIVAHSQFTEYSIEQVLEYLPKLPYPIRLFLHRKDAETWLRSITPGPVASPPGVPPLSPQ